MRETIYSLPRHLPTSLDLEKFLSYPLDLFPLLFLRGSPAAALRALFRAFLLFFPFSGGRFLLGQHILTSP
jgi:hypothetical protein